MSNSNFRSPFSNELKWTLTAGPTKFLLNMIALQKWKFICKKRNISLTKLHTNFLEGKRKKTLKFHTYVLSTFHTRYVLFSFSQKMSGIEKFQTHAMVTKIEFSTARHSTELKKRFMICHQNPRIHPCKTKPHKMTKKYHFP